MFITAEHLASPVPIEDEPKLMVGFVQLVKERLPIANLPERMIGVQCEYSLDEDTSITLEVWRDSDGGITYEARVEDQVTDWLGEEIVCERERVYRVNPIEMTAEYVVEWERYNGETQKDQTVADEEADSVFTTAHLAEITWLLERMPKSGEDDIQF